jgi:hypothetical protein
MSSKPRRKTQPSAGFPDLGAVVLVEPWNNVAAGTRFDVLAPGENPRPGAVDPRRAATLIAQGLAKHPQLPLPEQAADQDQNDDEAGEED